MTQPHNTSSSLPWWTWIVPPLVFHLGTQISLQFQYAEAVSSFYLPTGFLVILLMWWGPWRTIPAMYLNAALSTPLWGDLEFYKWFIYPIPETLLGILAWLLFKRAFKGKYWLPDTRQTILFVLFAVALPLVVELLLLQTTSTMFGAQPADAFARQFVRNFMGEFTANFGITLPLLYRFTPIMQQKKLLIDPPPFQLQRRQGKTTGEHLFVSLVYTTLFITSITLPFERFWFIYGLVGLLLALRFGFGEALFCNFYVFLITYVSPVVAGIHDFQKFELDNPLYFVFLGNLLLSVFVALTGRVISDLRQTEEILHRQNQELERTNSELDKFAYSVSHDISAPLKSIQGLVNLIHLETDGELRKDYLKRIEVSVAKLNVFIRETLDYSRNNRTEIQPEPIHLGELIQEVMDDFRYSDEYKRISINIGDMPFQVVTDRLRLKVILHNLISNAFKFCNSTQIENPKVELSAQRHGDMLQIKVTDNGEGIRPEIKPRVFEMFVRGSFASNGSGLGLYISREAAKKIGATIEVELEFGMGATFTITMPLSIN